MAIEHITIDPEALPTLEPGRYSNPEIVDFLRNLVAILQNDYLRLLIGVSNRTLDLSNVGTYYFRLPDIYGDYSEGTVRLRQSADYNIKVETLVGSNWTEIGGFGL